MALICDSCLAPIEDGETVYTPPPDTALALPSQNGKHAPQLHLACAVELGLFSRDDAAKVTRIVEAERTLSERALAATPVATLDGLLDAMTALVGPTASADDVQGTP